MKIRQILQSLGLIPNPRTAECCVLRIEISGLDAMADQINPENFLRSINGFQSEMAILAAGAMGCYSMHDIGDYLIAIPSDKNPNYVKDAIDLARRVDESSQRLSARFDDPRPRIVATQGLACGKAFFSSGRGQTAVMGQVVNQAGYARLGAKALGKKIAVDDDSRKLFSDKLDLTQHVLSFAEDGKQIKIHTADDF